VLKKNTDGKQSPEHHGDEKEHVDNVEAEFERLSQGLPTTFVKGHDFLNVVTYHNNNKARRLIAVRDPFIDDDDTIVTVDSKTSDKTIQNEQHSIYQRDDNTGKYSLIKPKYGQLHNPPKRYIHVVSDNVGEGVKEKIHLTKQDYTEPLECTSVATYHQGTAYLDSEALEVYRVRVRIPEEQV
jgi:hypothetical protein